MVIHIPWWSILVVCMIFHAGIAFSQSAGSIRGTVYDNDFDAPLVNVQIAIIETGAVVTSSSEGTYVFPQVAPGTYTLVFSKDGYVRQVRSDVLVSSGQLTEVNIWLSGDFTDMEEFVVQYVQLVSETEAALLELRMESPSLMDSISADLMSQAGASDAASALRLVAGASVQDGKFAVIRGLPDRYVNSQMNKVRLPTSDEDKRAVQLDQFPSAAIESIQVSKTFTPDQQGDASGGAVNVVTKGIPDESVLNFSAQMGANSQAVGNGDYLTYDGGGVSFWGFDDGGRDIQFNNIGSSWDGAVGVIRDDAPLEAKFSTSAGGKYELSPDWTLGALGSFFYERGTTYFENGIDDKWWIESPDSLMTPQFTQGTPGDGDFKTQLFDVSQGSQETKWGTLGVFGLETEDHSLSLLHMFTQSTEDTATLAEDTRGKFFYFPDYDVSDPRDPGNRNRDSAPFIRTETLEYTERSTQTLQLNGQHTLPELDLSYGEILNMLQPEVDWTMAFSSSTLDQPDKRQFGSTWWANSFNPGFPPFIPPSTNPEVHRSFKPAANFTLGNLQRTWKDISEESDQFAINLKLPFEQWSGDEGYVKMGVFYDEVKRDYNQESFSNFNDDSDQFPGPFEDFWSAEFPLEEHPVTPGQIDVDYDGAQEIFAWYQMMDLPIDSTFKLVGGARVEHTKIGIINFPEDDVTWIPPGSSSQVTLNPGDADVNFVQTDTLPSIGFVYTPWEPVTLRTSYSQTIARQTFKELSPIQQQEFLGSDVFIGNPFLQMSSLKNYDVRVDYTPYEGGLLSASWFYKDIKDPIEYVQRVVEFPYTTPVNYPEGTLSGFEFEVRQQMGQLWDPAQGLALGANATLIHSEVSLPQREVDIFRQPNIDRDLSTRDMTNAPEHLYNFFLTYEMDALGLEGTQLGLFYTIRGDTLVAGAGQSSGNFVPNVYETEFGSLNLSLTQQLGETWRVRFQAKNLTDPEIESVYRTDGPEGDVVKTRYTKGMDFSITVSARF